MEHVEIKLGQDDFFDQIVRDGLPEGGDLVMITKDVATDEGRPAVCLSFTVQLPDGKHAKAQVVTTVRMFQAMAAALVGRYGNL